MKFGQKLVYIILKHLQKNAVENITLSPRKLISKFWSTGATMGGRGLNVRKLYIKHNLTHEPFNLYMLVSSYSIGQGAG